MGVSVGGGRRLGRLALTLPVAAALLAAGSAGASGTAGTSGIGDPTLCSLSGGLLRVEFTGDNGNGFFERRASGEIWNGSCLAENPTVTNTDRIRIVDSSNAGQLVQMRLEEGPLAPGATDEGDGTSEIEVLILFGSNDEAEPPGPPGAAGAVDELRVDLERGVPHRVRVGQRAGLTALNLNAGEEAAGTPDADISLDGLEDFGKVRLSSVRGENIQLKSWAGDDRILGNGGPGFDGGSGVPLVIKAGGGDNRLVGSRRGDSLNADDGDDRLSGGAGNDGLYPSRGDDTAKGGAGKDDIDAGAGDDTLVGGPARDTMTGKGGRDLFKARDGKRDKIDCGPGKDKVLADRKDRVKGNCEKVKRR